MRLLGFGTLLACYMLIDGTDGFLASLFKGNVDKSLPIKKDIKSHDPNMVKRDEKQEKEAQFPRSPFALLHNLKRDTGRAFPSNLGKRAVGKKYDGKEPRTYLEKLRAEKSLEKVKKYQEKLRRKKDLEKEKKLQEKNMKRNTRSYDEKIKLKKMIAKKEAKRHQEKLRMKKELKQIKDDKMQQKKDLEKKAFLDNREKQRIKKHLDGKAEKRAYKQKIKK